MAIRFEVTGNVVETPWEKMGDDGQKRSGVSRKQDGNWQFGGYRIPGRISCPPGSSFPPGFYELDLEKSVKVGQGGGLEIDYKNLKLVPVKGA